MTDYVDQSIYGKFLSNTTENNDMFSEFMYRRMFIELSANRFKWINLPEEIDPRFLEMTLFFNALSVFYYDDDFNKFMAVRAGGTGAINMLDNPTSFIVLLNGTNGFPNKTLSAEDCVPIWSNYTRVPDYEVLSIYSKRLSAFDVTVDTNIIQLRHPTVFAVEESQRQTFANIFRNIKRGEPAIFGYKGLTRDALKDQLFALNTGITTNMVTDVQISKAKVWNEAMTYLGINNSNQEKRERLVEDEVSANNDQINAFRNIALNSRKLACEEINRKYNLDIDVEWNMDNNYDQEVEEPETDDENADNEEDEQ